MPRIVVGMQDSSIGIVPQQCHLKALGNLIERLNFRRMEVSSERCLYGKLFVEFVALIFLFYLKKVIQEKLVSALYDARATGMNWT
ncbi:hypothetical protein J25TS5_01950 [Paenibacillus faecis]|uniref:hypothetical protein n=1 Tax=Paenibacillus faecis TaxID=862114 RepID=UPI001B0F4E91|nr:hypothetical protein [Paenibacillus faecis]GIO83263.1 hypothetical protein J25TS5_01950 [Paenibacillus faecis]